MPIGFGTNGMHSTHTNPGHATTAPASAAPHEVLGGALPIPALPTLLATRLQLELLLSSDAPVDLAAAAGIIRNDLGATLEIFRRAGEEMGAGSEVPARLEDCLASLGTDVWMETVCADAVERAAADSAHLAELVAFWEQGRLAACACWLLASRGEGICPEEAYLAGLLHRMAQLPHLLRWAAVPGLAAACSGTRLAAHWRLPAYLRTLLVAPDAVAPPWAELLAMAEAWSDPNPAPESAGECVSPLD